MCERARLQARSRGSDGRTMVDVVVDVVQRIRVGNSVGIMGWEVVSPEARELINAS